MQVRKFEAKTIKEAIELVKFHLGPDAIILSAKDNDRGFGLMGESSVEVTAAVSESKLSDKKIAERKLDHVSKQKYQASSARVQKEYIQKSSDQRKIHFEEANEPTPTPLPKRNGVTQMRYVDIDETGAQQPMPVIVPQMTMSTGGAEQSRIASLQNEIHQLRSMLEKFQKVPQNFVTLHPGADEGLSYDLSFAFKRLLDAGVAHQNAVDILKIANDVLPNEKKKKRAFVGGWVIKYFLDHIKINDKPMKGKYHIFVGPTGQGKTSTVVKMACHLMMKEKKRIAILSGDHVKVGATDQLKIYAQILNVPCGAITKSQDWLAVDKALQNVDYVLLDTPGVNLKGPSDLETLRNVLPPNMSQMSVHYVQSGLARDTDAFEIAERFKIIGFQDVIFTRLDEAVQHGIIYNFQKKFDVPLHSFGIGSGIPEDFEFATKERVVDLIFNLSKIRKERGTA